MSKIFNQSAIDFANKSMEEINSELDLVYCSENKVNFPNSEVDLMSINLYSKESTDTAYDILHPKE